MEGQRKLSSVFFLVPVSLILCVPASHMQGITPTFSTSTKNSGSRPERCPLSAFVPILLADQRNWKGIPEFVRGETIKTPESCAVLGLASLEGQSNEHRLRPDEKAPIAH